jgi:hypothetical protein
MKMASQTAEKKSQLIASLREGVAVVQMVLFKEIKARLIKKQLSKDQTSLSMLAGSITNEVFGNQNPEKKFVTFRQDNMVEIEQEILSLKTDMPKLCAKVTDALRIQTLCDRQEGEDSSETLISAKESGFLIEEREVPLPSTFMTIVRLLGEEHNLIVPPTQITPEQDQSMVH